MLTSVDARPVEGKAPPIVPYMVKLAKMDGHAVNRRHFCSILLLRFSITATDGCFSFVVSIRFVFFLTETLKL